MGLLPWSSFYSYYKLHVCLTSPFTYLTKLNLHSSAARVDCLIRLNYIFTLKTDRKFAIDFYAKYVWIPDLVEIQAFFEILYLKNK